MKSFEDAVKFHGHSCGGLAMGYKLAEYVTKLLDVRKALAEKSDGSDFMI